MTISELLLPEFDKEIANTRKMLAIVPEDKLDYKPHELSMPLGRLAGHIAEIPKWAQDTMDKTHLDMKGGDYTPFVFTTRDAILAHFDESAKSAHELIAKASDDDMLTIWTMTWNGQQVVSNPRYIVLRDFVLSHIIHHRAQLGVYLRMNNVEIPGMYGPSADEMKYWAPPSEQKANA